MVWNMIREFFVFFASRYSFTGLNCQMIQPAWMSTGRHGSIVVSTQQPQSKKVWNQRSSRFLSVWSCHHVCVGECVWLSFNMWALWQTGDLLGYLHCGQSPRERILTLGCWWTQPLSSDGYLVQPFTVFIHNVRCSPEQCRICAFHETE